jgi:thiamine biosynthesis protein ThiS
MSFPMRSDTAFPTETVAVCANGETRRVPLPATVETLLREMGLAGRRGIAVAVGDQVVPCGKWSDWHLDGNEQVLVIQATQGG